MKKTGTYKWNTKTLSIEKISDEIPNINCVTDVWFPKGGYKYFDKQLQRTFHSKQEKRDWLKNNKMTQTETTVNKRSMIKNNCEIINADRKKMGLKAKTESAIVGSN